MPLPVLWMNAKHTPVILSQARRGNQHGDDQKGHGAGTGTSLKNGR
jgi:hypothetical protein